LVCDTGAAGGAAGVGGGAGAAGAGGLGTAAGAGAGLGGGGGGAPLPLLLPPMLVLLTFHPALYCIGFPNTYCSPDDSKYRSYSW